MEAGYQCGLCGKGFGQREALNRHLTQVHKQHLSVFRELQREDKTDEQAVARLIARQRDQQDKTDNPVYCVVDFETNREASNPERWCEIVEAAVLKVAKDATGTWVTEPLLHEFYLPVDAPDPASIAVHGLTLANLEQKKAGKFD